MEQLDGLRALVTGGGSGIGAAIAARLKQGGARVLVVDVDPPTSPDVVADVADTAAVDDLFTEVSRRLGGLDVLVNNVGVAGPTAAVEDMDPDDFDRCVQVNLGSMFRCTRKAVPLLRERPGSIVNISSTAGIFGYPLRSPYAAAKWAVVGLTKTWAMELGSAGVRVNAICPGSVGGSRMDGVIEREAAARRCRRREPSGRRTRARCRWDRSSMPPTSPRPSRSCRRPLPGTSPDRCSASTATPRRCEHNCSHSMKTGRTGLGYSRCKSASRSTGDALDTRGK